MKKRFSILSAILFLLPAVALAQDFGCMQDCSSQGGNRNYCVTMCGGSQAPGGMMNQPGLPKNPAFDQMQQQAAPARRNQPIVADPKCLKDCQNRGYNYMLCQQQCSYSLYGR